MKDKVEIRMKPDEKLIDYCNMDLMSNGDVQLSEQLIDHV